MRKLLYVFCLMLFISCTSNDYKIEIKQVGSNSIVYSDVVSCYEGIGSRGKDASAGVNCEQIVADDTVYMFYYPVIYDQERHKRIKIKSSKPIYVSSFKCLTVE